MAAFSPKNFLNLFAKFYRSPTFPQIFVFVFFGLRGRIQVYSFRNTIWNSEIFWNILKNRKLPTDFYLVAIWQLNPVKGYKDFLFLFMLSSSDCFCIFNLPSFFLHPAVFLLLFLGIFAFKRLTNASSKPRSFSYGFRNKIN